MSYQTTLGVIFEFNEFVSMWWISIAELLVLVTQVGTLIIGKKDSEVNMLL